MKHEALEKRLRKKRIIRRSIELGLAILFAVLFFVSYALLESTAEIVEHIWAMDTPARKKYTTKRLYR
ncbi:MAG: hypothetical protein IJC64_02900 [Clostridia bacterium]|nr:hypothetical protein [Clostridia bacterium]